MPQPEVLGRNGTYIVFRKLQQRVAAFRQYLKANSTGSEAEEFLAAKMMVAGGAVPLWRFARPLTIPNSGPTRNATTTFSMQKTMRLDTRPHLAAIFGG